MAGQNPSHRGHDSARATDEPLAQVVSDRRAAAMVANGLTHGVQSPKTPQEIGTAIQMISQNIVGRMFSAISCDP